MEYDVYPWNNTNENKYQYNGKELNDDFGLNLSDYGARWYDAAIGRWWSVDPLAILAADITPYRYGLNNPVKLIDPNGLFESEAEAKKYADENGIKIRPKSFFGMLFTSGSRSNIVKNEDGGYSIINKSERTDIRDYGGDIGIQKGVVVSPNDVMSTKQESPYLGLLGGTQQIMTLRDGTEIKTPVLAGEPPVGFIAKGLKALPTLDATGKVHGILPKLKDLPKYSKEELKILLNELEQSVKKRIEVTSILGRDKAHGQRQSAEQQIIKFLEKFLKE